MNGFFTQLWAATTESKKSLDSVLDKHIWAGRGGDKMHYNTMHSIYQRIVKALNKSVHKNTHLARVYSAEMLYESGISMSKIAIAGDWSSSHLSNTYIVPSLSPKTLLAANGWKQTQGLDSFYSPRFDARVPDALVDYLFPDLPRLEEVAKEKKQTSYAALVKFGAHVLIQDALEEALEFEENPVYKYLLQNEHFR